MQEKMVMSYITNDEYKNLKIQIRNFTPSGFIIVRFALPFQLPLDESGGIYSSKNRKGLKVKHKYTDREYSEIRKVTSEVDVISVLLDRITPRNEDRLISKAINDSLDFLNNIIKVLITRFKYEDFTQINRYELPVGLPVWICKKSKFNEKNLEAKLFVNFHFANLEREHVLLSSEERRDLVTLVENLDQNPYFDLAVLFSEASNLYKIGSFHSGFLKIHACIERLMYAMVKEIFIRQGKPQDKIDNIPQIAYKDILTQHLGPYFTKNGLLFGIENKYSIAYKYWTEVYSLRNKIVHSGYRLTESEALNGHKIVWELTKLVIVTMKKLGYKNINKYLTDSEESLIRGYQWPY
ncbi:TPA: hypothetical protein RD613_003194 [Enterococcus faecium]|uniref:hypothetical protein n=1 Tax=Enterococcus faecium TaxID=1352 RepID=UPI0027F9BC5A|nr:hypothetical protein [Enterococcus faecium]